MGFHPALQGCRLSLFPGPQPDMGGTPHWRNLPIHSAEGVICVLPSGPCWAGTHGPPSPVLAVSQPTGPSPCGERRVCSLICSQDGDP